MEKRRKPEILAPAGSWESLAAAIKAEAEAVYFGLDKLNQRALKKKFTIKDLPQIREFTAEKGVRAYLTLNSMVYEDDLDYIDEVLHAVKENKIDAVIGWDMAVILKSLELGIETHMSVMTGIANSVSANFFKRLGVKRIVPAKELNYKQLLELKKKTGLEIEVFVHGAMCMAISGRCFLSHDVFKTSANRGECYQVCRHKFEVKIKDLNDTSGNREFILGENYILSATDLMTLDIVEYLTVFDAWKIEGRNKNPDYVYMVTKAYRTARDALLEGTFNNKLREELIDTVKRVYHRDWDSGFYFGAPGFGINRSKATEQKVYVGVVEKYYPRIGVVEVKIETGELKIGDIIHIIGKKTGLVRQKVESMQIDRKPIEVAKAPTRIGLKVIEKVREGDKVFVMKPISEEEKLELARYKD
jgi:putative protease